MTKPVPIPFAWLACVMVALGLAGCGSGVRTVRAWGDVRWRGRPVEDGVIVFFPIEGTAGPSTGGVIVDGRYDVPAAKGPRAGGVYRVEITAAGEERTYSPDVGPSGADAQVTVSTPLIPANFNTATTLRTEVAEGPDGHKQDFLLE